MAFFRLDHVTETDLGEFTLVEYLSYTNPWLGAVQILFPVNEKLSVGPEQAIQNCAGMHKAQLASSTLHLIKVVDKQSSRIVGGAIWKAVSAADLSTTKPDARWQPEGSDRDAANAFLSMPLANYRKWFKHDHLFLQVMFVHPKFRHGGIASMMMDWGIKFADERGWQIYLNSTKMAIPLYAKHGFHAYQESKLSFDHLEETDRLKELRQIYLPYSSWPMVRPTGGVYRQGVDKLPWELFEANTS